MKVGTAGINDAAGGGTLAGITRIGGGGGGGTTNVDAYNANS